MKKLLLFALLLTTMHSFAQPSNNECAMSTNIAVSTMTANTYTADTLAATETVVGNCQISSFTDPDVWYNFTMPVNGNIRITGITSNDYINVYDSCGGTEIACFFNDDVIYGLEANENYILKFARYNNGMGVYDFTIQAFEVPDNNDCINSEPIVVSKMMPTTYTASTIGATETVEGSCESPGFIDPDVWFNFTMPVDGTLFVSNNSSNNYINIYDNCGGTEVACFFGNQSVYNLTGGVNYILRFARYNNGSGTYNFTMQAFELPANDLCANSVNIAVSATVENTYTANTQGASETMEGSCESIGFTDPDVWFDFTMPVTGNLMISNITSNDYINIYDACGGTEIDCFFNDGVVEGLNAGQDYILKFARYNNGNGMYDFTVQALAALPNDECDNRETLIIPTTEQLTVTTDLNSATATDPAAMLPNPCGASVSATYVDVWYEFVMPVNGNLQITNTDGPSEAITLYNACGDTTDVGCEFGGGIIYDLTGGATYIMRYSDRDINLNSNSDFRIQAFVTIDNDECDDRETLVVTTTEELMVISEFRGATPTDPAAMLPNPCGANANHTYVDAWYDFVMPVDGNIAITNTDGSSEVVTLYNMCGDTVEVDCEFGGGIIYDLTGGTTYIMRYSDRDVNVNTNSDFRIQAFATIDNDECDDRETLVVTTTEELTVISEFRGATPTDPATMLPNPCGTNANHTYVDAWYDFVMPVDGNIAITNTDGSSEAITLYSLCGDTVELGCELGGGIIYDLTGGATYIMRYSDRDVNVNGNSDFRIQAFEAIANDECDARETIIVTTTEQLMVTSELRSATPTDPALMIPNPCEANANHIYVDAWYDFIMPVDGNIVITNNNGTSEAITLYDNCGDTIEVGCEFGGGIIYDLTGGATYIMRYSDRNVNVNSNSDFGIQAFETSANDECSNAETLNISALSPTNVITDLRGASNDSEISCENNSTRTYLDVWYDITMPIDGELQVNNVNNSMSIAFFDDCNGNELTCFFNDGSLFNVAAGTNVKMRASIRDLFAGEFTFDIIAIPAPLPSCSGTTEFISGEWNNGVPDNTMNAIIRSNYNTSTTIDPATMMPYGSLEACSIFIDSGRTLTIASEDYLEVTDNILVNGTLNVAHQGSVVQLDPMAITTNNGAINVNVTTPDLPARTFMILGSPMTAETRTDVFANAFRVRNHVASNFIPDPTVAAAFPLAENFADNNGDNWINYSGTINPAEGYLVSPQPNINASGIYNLTYNEGTLNNGDITFPVVFNTDKNSSPNILANPYASAILADDFINANAMVDEVYFWEHLTPPSAYIPGYNNMNFTMEDISMYNLMGGVKASSDASSNEDTKPNGIISTAQGFGIKANAAGMATFSNNMRRLNGNTTLRAPEEDVNKVWVAIETPAYNLKSNTLIGFTANATAQLDAGYDSKRMASILSIFSGIDNSDVELGIQGREPFTESMTIPLGFSSQIDANTQYRISLNDIEGLALNQATIYLEDLLTGTKTNLTEEMIYEFTSNKGQFPNRFMLYFKYRVLDNASETLAAFSIAPNPGSGIFTINSQNQIIENITVYDYLGRNISIKNDLNISETIIDISSQASGFYFINVQTNKGALAKKYIKK